MFHNVVVMFVLGQGSPNNIKQGGKTLSMSMSKLLITLGLILLMTTPIAIAHAEDSYSGSGTAVVSDAGAMSDRVTFSMSGVSMLEAGSAFEGWLVNSDTDDKVSAGILTVLPGGSISHSWTSPDGGNLLEMYDMAVITVEPVPDDDSASSGVIAFSDMVDGGAMTHIRHLVVAAPGSDMGFMSQLQAQVSMAMMKVSEAQAADSINALKASTEEAVAIIDGEGGILALAAASEHAGFAAMAAPGEEMVGTYSKMVMASGSNVSAWAMAAKDDAAAVTAEDNLDTAKTLLNIVNGKLMAAADGIEASGMGGASDAYMQAQKMATFTLPGPAPAAAVTPATGDTYVPAAMQIMLFVALMLLIGGGAMLYRERRLGTKA